MFYKIPIHVYNFCRPVVQDVRLKVSKVKSVVYSSNKRSEGCEILDISYVNVSSHMKQIST